MADKTTNKPKDAATVAQADASTTDMIEKIQAATEAPKDMYLAAFREAQQFAVPPMLWKAGFQFDGSRYRIRGFRPDEISSYAGQLQKEGYVLIAEHEAIDGEQFDDWFQPEAFDVQFKGKKCVAHGGLVYDHLKQQNVPDRIFMVQRLAAVEARDQVKKEHWDKTSHPDKDAIDRRNSALTASVVSGTDNVPDGALKFHGSGLTDDDIGWGR